MIAKGRVNIMGKYENKSLAELYQLARAHKIVNYVQLEKWELAQILQDKEDKIRVKEERKIMRPSKPKPQKFQFPSFGGSGATARNFGDPAPARNPRKKAAPKAPPRAPRAPRAPTLSSKKVADISQIFDPKDLGRRAATKAINKKGLTLADLTKTRATLAKEWNLVGRHLKAFHDGWYEKVVHLLACNNRFIRIGNFYL